MIQKARLIMFRSFVLAAIGKRIVMALVMLLSLFCGQFALAADLAVPQDGETMRLASNQLAGRRIILPLNKSVIIELPETVTDVLVSDPKVADAMIRTPKRIYLIGMAIGETNIFLFGQGNAQLARFEVRVDRDLGDLASLINRLVPGAAVKVESVNGAAVLTGTAMNQQDIGKIGSIAGQFLSTSAAGAPNTTAVVNLVTTNSGDQVHLKVVVAEVQREAIKNLGLNTEALLENSGLNTTYTSGTKTITQFNPYLSAVTTSTIVRALGQNGLMRTLAEPTLTAISGESATFLAGGEFPIPISQSQGSVSVEYKKYGIGLSFTPVVLGPGRISLRIQTEVSDLTSTGAVTLNSTTIPALTVRRAESTVELPSGGSIVMAGLIKDNVSQIVQGLPGLMDVPVLGSLFRSRQFQREQTELAVFVTPYVVNAVNGAEMTRPDQNMQASGDAQAIFMNKFIKTYKNGNAPAKGSYQGRVGFTFD